MHARHLLGLPLAGALLGLAACSGQAGVTGGVADPPVDRFAPGVCRSVAPAVLDIGRAARDALSGHGGASATESLTESLTKGQQALRAAQNRARPAQRRELQPLVTAIGIYRIRALSNTVSPPVAAAVATAQHRLVLRCAPGGGR